MAQAVWKRPSRRPPRLRSCRAGTSRAARNSSAPPRHEVLGARREQSIVLEIRFSRRREVSVFGRVFLPFSSSLQPVRAFSATRGQPRSGDESIAGGASRRGKLVCVNPPKPQGGRSLADQGDNLFEKSDLSRFFARPFSRPFSRPFRATDHAAREARATQHRNPATIRSKDR